LGIGDWGLGPIPNPQSPIPNPQSPSPFEFNNLILLSLVYKINYLINFNKNNKLSLNIYIKLKWK
jgi:hypothetical protein